MTDRHAPRILSVATAFPPFTVDVAATIAGMRRLFPAEDPAFVAQLVERSGVERRHLACDVEGTLQRRSFDEKNRQYQEIAFSLANDAARRALERARVEPERIDVVIDTSCTGIAIPALDTALAPALGLRPDVRRIPITESGCAAGALALGLAGELGRLGKTTLVVAVELCSITLRDDDRSRTNVVSCAIFGDGAGAAVVGPGSSGPVFEWTASHLFPRSRHLMGFDVGSSGLGIVLDRELPVFLLRALKPALDGLLAPRGREFGAFDRLWVHPGGRRILEAITELYGLDEDALWASREALARHGNLSSATVFSVLEQDLARRSPRAGEHALLVGIGPGLSLEASAWRFVE